MILPDAVDRFGPLGESIEIKGSIALGQIPRHGMWLDVNQLAGVKARLQEQVDGLVAELEANPEWDGLLRRDREGELVLTEKGHAPSLSQARLRQLLEEGAASVAEESGEPPRIPKTAKGNISLSAAEWEDLAPFIPFLRCWLELAKATKSLQFFGKLTGTIVHPNYTSMVRTGRTSCSSSNIQQLPRKGGFREAFVPSPGHLFLICDYSYIELRTLAAVCEARYSGSKLADVIREGIDPHCYTAAMFEGMDLATFMKLKKSKMLARRERYDTLRQRAKVLNFGIPGGLGPRSLVGYARSTYGVTLTIEEAGAFRSRLIDEIYPELGLYLADDGMDALAWNLGASVQDCWTRFDLKGERSGATVGAIKKVVRGRPVRADGTPYKPGFVKRIWDGLIALNKVHELTSLLASRQGSEELFRRLFWSGVATLTGRVRGRVSFTQARNTPFQGLAADGAKLALWELIREGFRVVAFIHDEVLVELPVDADHTAEARRVETIMNRAMESVTGDVPVACEYALARRWSKKAKAIFDADGRLVPWEEDQR